MISLYGFGAGFGLPEISPFVTKTEVQLKMAGIAYRKEKAKPPASPKGQLPYIVDEAETIADSTFIRAHLEAKYGFDFDAPLSLQARAQAWAFERMIEHHVYWALVGARWVDGDNFAKGPRISSTGRRRTCAKSFARTHSSGSPRIICSAASAATRLKRISISPSLAVCVVGPAWRQAVSDGRNAMRHGRHRLRRARRNFDAVLRVGAAAANRAVRQPHRLCRPDDAAVLSGIRLGAGAAQAA